MSKAIHAKREELIEMGRINAGNTRGDAKFDIDGATGTLMFYAKLGESLGDQRLLGDGEAAKIGGPDQGSARARSPPWGGAYQRLQFPRLGIGRESGARSWPACRWSVSWALRRR